MSAPDRPAAPTVSEHDLDRLIELGRAAHPDLADPAGLRDFVAARATVVLAETALATRAGDLFIAAGCAAGDPAAITRLDRGLPAIVRPALARLKLPPSDDDEIIQRVRVALFAPDDTGATGIAGYSGRGELRAYLRAVAVRLALKRLEREQQASPNDDGDVLAMLPGGDDSPEVRLLKERCGGELRAAFSAALVALSPRERMLLRQHHVDGLTVAAIGKLHDVHKATAARWVEAARAKVLSGIRRHLRHATGLGESDLDSAIALVGSRLDLSLSRQLPRVPPPADDDRGSESGTD